MQKGKRILSLTLAMVLTLSACGGKDGEQGEKGDKPTALTEFVDWQLAANEMTTFLMLYSEEAVNGRVLGNAVSSLLQRDNHMVVQGAIATDWEHSDDAMTWTFHLRDDVTWVDVNGDFKANCVAQDWATSMEWILNFHKNGAKNTSMLTELIEGAAEYYAYTKELSVEEAYALKATDDKFKNTVGIEIPDDTTVIYHLAKPAPYFHTVTLGACCYPLSQAQVDELGVEGVFGQNHQTMWYNGPYRITEYIQNNSKTLTKNESYWDKECTLFDTVTIRMVEDGNADDNLFMNGEVDRCELSEARLRMIWEDESNPWRQYLVQPRATAANRQFMFNYAQKNADGTPASNWNTAIANEAFRKSIYYGMDLEPYWARFDFINPVSNWTETFTARDTVTFSDGTDYVDRLTETLGFTGPRYDAEKGKSYVEQARKELEGKVEFPIQADYYIKAGDQTAQDNAIVLKEIMESIADGYITMNIKTYITNATQEIYSPSLHSFTTSGWYADYSDPENFLNQLVSGSDIGYFATRHMMVNDITDPEAKELFAEYTRMTEAANAITDDLDKRYEAQIQAEAFLFEHALIVPLMGTSVWQMTKVNPYSIPTGSYTYKNYETSSEPYTAEQFEAFKQAYDNGEI